MSPSSSDHEVARASLADFGAIRNQRGHVSRTRIIPESADGYAQALHAANARADRTKGTTWKVIGAVTASGEGRAANLAIRDPPQEFAHIDLTALESRNRPVGPFRSNCFCGLGAIRMPRKNTARSEGLAGAGALPVHGALEVHVVNDLLLMGKPYAIGTIEATLQRLAVTGFGEEKTSTGQPLMDFKDVRAAKQPSGEVVCGRDRSGGTLRAKTRN